MRTYRVALIEKCGHLSVGIGVVSTEAGSAVDAEMKAVNWARSKGFCNVEAIDIKLSIKDRLS